MIKRENSSIGTYSQSETEQALKCLQCTHCSENTLPVFAAVTDTRAIQATRTTAAQTANQSAHNAGDTIAGFIHSKQLN